MSKRMTKDLALSAWEMPLLRNPPEAEPMQHSVRGSQEALASPLIRFFRLPSWGGLRDLV